MVDFELAVLGKSRSGFAARLAARLRRVLELPKAASKLAVMDLRRGPPRAGGPWAPLLRRLAQALQ